MPTTTTAAVNDDKKKEKQPVIIIAAVEGGGTSFKVAVCQVLADDDTSDETTTTTTSTTIPNILHRTTIDSSHDNPQKTLEECSQFLMKHRPSEGYHALGISTFGPVGVNNATSSDKQHNYGCILGSSPKASWRNVNILEPLRRACQGQQRQKLKVLVDTDVNAPALAEYKYANDKSNNNHISSVAYITVGTGVGVGLIVNDKPVHGRMHPEGGHVLAQPLLSSQDAFKGYSWGHEMCPFRGINTVEGLACSVSLTERLQQMNNSTAADATTTTGNTTDNLLLSRNVLIDLPDDHEVWDHAANALACLCVNLLLTLSIEKIVLGGGIMSRKGLIDKIRIMTVQHLNGYLVLPDDMSDLITLSAYGNDAGLVGSIVLAQQALKEEGDEEQLPSSKQKEERETKIKKEVYGIGLWHGFLVGAVTAGLVCKYVIFAPNKQLSRR